jgi:hypothetical protein
LKKYVTIGEDLTPPYQMMFDPAVLPRPDPDDEFGNFNLLRAYALDDSEPEPVASAQPHIWVFREGETYLPLVVHNYP